jgi:hypothetical protein
VRRWWPILVLIALLGGGAFLVPGHFGLLGQPSVSFTANGNLPSAPSAKPTPSPSTTQPQAAPKPPCIQPGAVSHDNANVPFRSPSHPSPLFKQAVDDFGPPPGTKVYDLNGAKAELRFRLCGQGESHGRGVGPDQRLFAALWTKVNGGNPNDLMSNGTWVREVNQFVGHDILWSEASLEYRYYANPWTELQIPGTFPKIYLVQGTVHSDLFLRLPVRAKNGQIKILWLRRDCGFQPYDASPQDFPPAVPVASVTAAYTAGAPVLAHGGLGPNDFRSR